jgi:hypothetical protein
MPSYLRVHRVLAVLVANTYHEFMQPSAILNRVLHALHSGGRLVVVDQGPLPGETDPRNLPDGDFNSKVRVFRPAFGCKEYAPYLPQ